MGLEDVQDKVILATSGYDHSIHFWQAHSGVCQRSVQHPSSQVNHMDITPNRQLLAAAGFQHIRMYDIFSNNPNPVINYEGVTKNVTHVGFQEDGRWMYTGSEDNAARIWDLRSRTLQCQRVFSTSFPVNCVCLHPNQSELYIGDQGGSIYLWDLAQSDRNEAQVKQPFFKVADTDVSIQSIDIDAEGTFMAAVDNKGNCYLFTLSAGADNLNSQPKRRLKLLAHKNYALKCKFSPDSTLLVTTSADCTAKLWRTSDLHFLLEHPETPTSPTSIQNSSYEWKIAPAAPMVELKDANQRWVWDVAFSADSQYIFTASSDNLARLWSVSTGEIKREYSGHSKALTSLAFKDGT